ncbi:MAG: NAD-dependent deacylase [Ichthyobacteriaceae bacterium]|nr:NAD-dependent deacylase [Ichthyobacteriaceae bacterium]
MKRIVIFSGSGLSKESGIPTFRDFDGLWQDYDPRELATINALKTNTEKVMDFYNMRRNKMWESFPNAAHQSIIELEKKFEVKVITQNVDNLHERAGSENVLHIHGELSKVRSMIDEELIYSIEEKKDVNLGDLCSKGSQLRPHIVLFGEPVPKIKEAIEIVKTADILIVIGTSLQVYPAAELIEYTKEDCETYIINPEIPSIKKKDNRFFITEKACIGLPKLVHKLLN